LDLIVRIFRHERYHPCRSRLSLVVDGVNYQRVWVCIPAFWNAVIKRGFEQEKRLAALKTKGKKLLRAEAINDGPQEFEDLADELDEMAQLTWALKRKKRRKNDREVTSLDLLEAADMLGAS
jgi:hypothetical protein